MIHARQGDAGQATGYARDFFRQGPDAMLRPVVLCLLFCAPALAARAEEPISTDRPDVANSSDTVGRGRWQVEAGIAWDHARAGTASATNWSTPVLLRIGTGERWEARIGSDGWQYAVARADGLRTTASGVADLDLGVKYHWASSGPAGASLAWLVDAILPGGARAVRGHGVRPSLMLAAEWDLPHGNGLAVMPGVVHDTDDTGRRFDAGVLAASFGHAWTARTHTFVEVAGQQFAAAKHGGNVVTFDTGATWLLNNDTQVDVAADFGLSQAAPDEALTIGWSHRW